jgi:hypothetical protein
MSKLKVVVLLFVGGVLGFGAAWVGSGRATRHAFRATREIAIVDREGHRVGGLPAGTVLISTDDLRDFDIGWFGDVSIYLGDGHEASEVVVPTSMPSASIMNSLVGRPATLPEEATTK